MPLLRNIERSWPFSYRFLRCSPRSSSSRLCADNSRLRKIDPGTASLLLLRPPFRPALPASGARRSVPLVADGLLPQAAEVRENQRAVGERRSGLAQGELAPPRRPAGPHGRPLLASVLEGALKRSEAPRNLGEQSLGGPPGVAHAEQQAQARSIRATCNENGSEQRKRALARRPSWVR
jgi:hypothetical protein